MWLLYFFGVFTLITVVMAAHAPGIATFRIGILVGSILTAIIAKTRKRGFD